MKRQQGRPTGLTRGGKEWTPRFLERLDAERCTGCGFCVKVCPVHVFQGPPHARPTVVRLEECIGCRVCFNLCKDRAIELEELEGET
ncbi:MAG TPA: 4Fe-4S binding protein [Candidatus Ozemobacteraceae bacterium]|nr:4Fe-4S binding protein [Candidatus Ozemobacteraceae bacterium]